MSTITNQTADGGACDLESGVCAIPGAEAQPPTAPSEMPASGGVTTRTLYITDPICSACWILEPAWQSLTARYGDLLDVEYVYGGLLPDWEGFGGGQQGIRSPDDVAKHWDEFSEISGQPINSSVWAVDPIASSYPPSIAAVAVRLLTPEMEERYLRRVREELFMHGRNIARPELLESLAAELGLDTAAYRSLLADGSAEAAFHQDLERVRSLGVRGFPTLILEGSSGRLVLNGWVAPDRLEDAYLAVSGADRRPHLATIAEATAHLPNGTPPEYAAILGRLP